MLKLFTILFIFIISFNLNSQSIYKTQPNVSSCEEGELTESEKEKVLNYVNRVRLSHSLPPVTYDNSGDIYAQKGALVTVANRALSHTPPSSWSCFSQDAYYGNENSNLFIYLSSAPTQISSEVGIIEWMIDEDVENLGHRRAIINPFVDKISFGRVEGNVNNAYVIGMNLKYLDNLDANIINSNIDFVAYPQGNYDKDYFLNGWYLSFHVIKDKVNWWNNTGIDYSATTISVKDSKGNQVGVNSISSDNQGWGGLTNMIKWKCSTLNYYETYTVEIKNVKFNGNFKDYTYNFTLGDGPTGELITPSLLAPLDEAEDIKLNQVFSWSKDDETYTYNLQISETDDFASLIENVNGLTSNEYNSNKLENEKTYYWRVQAENKGAKSSWSEVRSFTTEEYSPLAPQIISPIDSEVSVRVKPYFEWENVDDKYTYDLQVGDRPTFSLKLVDEKKLSSTTFNSISKNMKPNTQYYWKVRSNDGELSGEWSDTYEFTTPPLPNEINLISPSNATELAYYNDWTFSWEESENATEYVLSLLEINEDGNEVNKVEFQTTETEFSLKLDDHQTRETDNAWSVTALNSGLEGIKSEIRTYNLSMVSVSQELNSNQINFFPNPVEDNLNLTIKDKSFLNSRYKIYDNLGNKINEGIVSTITFHVNLESFSSGSYIIIIDKNDQKFYSKFIKK